MDNTHKPCPCGKSSDAYTEYSDGHGYCFSCDKYFGTENVLPEATKQIIPFRGLSRKTLEKYNAYTNVIEDKPHSVVFPYGNGRKKVRMLNEKKFFTEGKPENETGYLFGRDRFTSGSAKVVTITEGEIDAMSVYEIMGDFPVVSVSSASSAKKDCIKDQDFLDSFDKIVLCFDNDGPGQEATQSVASLFDFNKVYVVKLDKHKDANAYLTAGDDKAFRSSWWSAKRFLPETVLSSYSQYDDIIDKDVDKKSVPYPFDGLNDMTYGIRTGEVVLFKALEGIGKTEIMRAIEAHLLKTTDDNLGIIHLEESKARCLKGLAGYQIGSPVHLPDSQVSNDETKQAIRDITRRDDRLHIYSHFGSDDPDIILNTIRFLVSACGCKYIFLDHITMVVSGLDSEDERRALDRICTRLAMMVEELDFALLMVSHVNDNGQTRGSRYISKIADLIISLDRNIEAETAIERNTTSLTLNKNRFCSTTGPGPKLVFDRDTYMITEKVEEEFITDTKGTT